MVFSTRSENDRIRVRDIRLHRCPPLKKKRKYSTKAHTPGLHGICRKVNAVSGVGLLALAGWVSQFEINFFSVFLPSRGPDQLPLCRRAFLIFKEGRWCVKQINCSFRNHICMASHFSFCQAGGISDIFFSPKKYEAQLGSKWIWKQFHQANKLHEDCFPSRRWSLMDAGVRFWTMNTCLANGHRGHPFPLRAYRRELGDGRKIISKCKARIKPWKLAQPYKLQSRNHAICTHRQAHTHTPQITRVRWLPTSASLFYLG